MNSLVRATAAIGVLTLVVGMVAAVNPASTHAAPPTIWNSLGIPQGPQRMWDAQVNDKGKHPNLEREPPLKKIADPANLESEIPAIKAAAEVKTQEDLAPQKIKAIKYLAEVGCSCYPGIQEALLAALDDCTEEVRYEAALALCRSAGNPCSLCSSTCCSPDVTAKLEDMADGTDEEGCPNELSHRVRMAARAALDACRARVPAEPEPAPREVPVETASTKRYERGWLVVSSDESRADSSAVFPTPPVAGSSEGIARSVSLDGPLSEQPQPLSEQPQPLSEQPQPLSEQPDSLGAVRPTQTSWTPDPELWKDLLKEEPGLAEATSKEVIQTTGNPDLASAISQSSTVQSTTVQRRSQVALDPHINGYKAGQIYTQANGVYWNPARQDLDAMLSKIDPGMIQDVIIIPGPYGLRYGPGFAFIDVIRTPTPRYACGTEIHFDTAGSLRSNGGQVYGRETVYGGGSDWGFRFSYGERRGSDYRAGNGDLIPTSYHNRDLWGEISYDINSYQRIDFAYQRLDQTDTEYPGQFFDVRDLTTYGFELRLVDENPAGPWSKLSVESWFNRTDFHGDTAAKSNPRFPVMQRVNWALDEYLSELDVQGRPRVPNYPQPSDPNNPASDLFGTTAGGLSSSGFRTSVVFGEADANLLRMGVDFRYLTQFIREDYTNDFGIPPNQADPDDPNLVELAAFGDNMPHSWMNNPGVYAEWSSWLHDDWKVSLGGRADFIWSTARASDLDVDSNLPADPDLLTQDDVLYAFYFSSELNLGEQSTLRTSFGHAQRPPTLIERYSDGLFLSIAQSGFTRVIGDPTLRSERDWQFDVGLSTGGDRWRGHANFFHAWVPNYITLEDGTVNNFDDARLLYYTNTDLATLVGFGMAGEFDLSERWSAFGAMSYVDGRDRQLDAPLPSMPPLDTTLGLRLADRCGGRYWGVELAARVVANQHRLGTIRSFREPVTIEEKTPSFDVWHLRGYWNRTETLSLVAGIENLFDRNYQEHLDLRLLGPNSYPRSPTRVLSPGFTPYFGLNWVF